MSESEAAAPAPGQVLFGLVRWSKTGAFPIML
jgi:hypothetical protein